MPKPAAGLGEAKRSVANWPALARKTNWRMVLAHSGPLRTAEIWPGANSMRSGWAGGTAGGRSVGRIVGRTVGRAVGVTGSGVLVEVGSPTGRTKVGLALIQQGTASAVQVMAHH